MFQEQKQDQSNPRGLNSHMATPNISNFDIKFDFVIDWPTQFRFSKITSWSRPEKDCPMYAFGTNLKTILDLGAC